MKVNTYLLVHGAWHGGWVWARVAERLRAAGHVVFTPTLTGCGDRSYLLSRETDFELNVRDILATLEFEELTDVVMCGHSYGGAVITAVADRDPDAVRALVYVDAYVPADGQSVMELRSAADNEVLMEQVRQRGDGWRMPPRSAAQFHVRRQSDRDWVDRHLTNMALRCFTQPVTLRGDAPGSRRRVYIRAADHPNERFQAHYETACADATWEGCVIQGTGHDIMVDQPGRLVEVLLKVQ